MGQGSSKKQLENTSKKLNDPGDFLYPDTKEARNREIQRGRLLTARTFVEALQDPQYRNRVQEYMNQNNISPKKLANAFKSPYMRLPIDVRKPIQRGEEEAHAMRDFQIKKSLDKWSPTKSRLLPKDIIELIKKYYGDTLSDPDIRRILSKKVFGKPPPRRTGGKKTRNRPPTRRSSRHHRFNFSHTRKKSRRKSRCRRVRSGPRKGRCYKTRSRSKRTSRRRRISYERPRGRSRSRRRCRRVRSGPRKGRCYKTRSRRRRGI